MYFWQQNDAWLQKGDGKGVMREGEESRANELMLSHKDEII